MINNIFKNPDLKSSLIREVEWIKTGGINNVVVIPAIAEYENIQLLINSLLQLEDLYLGETVFLFVINNSDKASDEIRKDNSASLRLLREIISNDSTKPLALKIYSSGLNLALIDASSGGKEIPHKISGVGAARKTGMDLSISLFDYNIPTNKLIICLDADCTVDANYLKEIKEAFTNNKIEAAVIDFEHKTYSNTGNDKVITMYEIFLRFYSCGLAFAGSPFSFHTIGSTIVCTDKAYKKSGGMNTKEAAEDFYFLQKIAKLFPVYRIFKTKVYPSARESWRVPFGTGRSMTDYIESGVNVLKLYNPEIFEILKDWLHFFYNSGFDPAENIITQAGSIHPGLKEFLVNKKFEKNWQNILDNSKSIEQLNRQKTNWFDAFKTLKLVHFLRDEYFPLVNMYESLDSFLKTIKIPVIFNDRNNSESEKQKMYLELLKAAEKILLFQTNKNLVIE